MANSISRGPGQGRREGTCDPPYSHVPRLHVSLPTLGAGERPGATLSNVCPCELSIWCGEAIRGSWRGGECWVGYMGGQTPDTGTSEHVCLGRVGCYPPLSGGPSPAPTLASPSPMVPPPPRLPHLCSPPMTSLLSGNGPSLTPALLLPGLGPGAEAVAQGSSVDPTVGPLHSHTGPSSLVLLGPVTTSRVNELGLGREARGPTASC